MNCRIARLLVLAVALCATGRPVAAADEPYVVNVVLPQTGQLAFGGAKQIEALRVLESYVNAQGGIKGRPMKFAISDDGSNPQTAIQLANDLIAKKVPVIMGPALSAVCAAMFALTAERGPVQYCYSPAVKPKSGSFDFFNGPAIEDVQPVVLRYFLSRGIRNMALLTSTDTSGSDFEARLDANLAKPEFKDSVKLVAREHFTVSDISVAAQMARIKAANPQVLLTFTTGTPFGTVLHAFQDSGMDIPVYGSGGNMNYAQIAQYATFLPKELYINGIRGIQPDPTATGKQRDAQNAFQDAMKKAGIRIEFSHALTWDPTLMVIDAIRALGTDVTAERLHDYLTHLKGWTGIEGTYDFPAYEQRGIGETAAALFRWDTSKSDWTQVAPARR